MDTIKNALGLGGSDQSGSEPVSGKTGSGTVDQPYDQGNQYSARSGTGDEVSGQRDRGMGETHSKEGGAASYVPQKVQEALPESVERAVPDKIHDTGDGNTLGRGQSDRGTGSSGTGESHAREGGGASYVPQRVQEALPESVERAVPDKIHDTGDGNTLGTSEGNYGTSGSGDRSSSDLPPGITEPAPSSGHGMTDRYQGKLETSDPSYTSSGDTGPSSRGVGGTDYSSTGGSGDVPEPSRPFGNVQQSGGDLGAMGTASSATTGLGDTDRSEPPLGYHDAPVRDTAGSGDTPEPARPFAGVEGAGGMSGGTTGGLESSSGSIGSTTEGYGSTVGGSAEGYAPKNTTGVGESIIDTRTAGQHVDLVQPYDEDVHKATNTHGPHPTFAGNLLDPRTGDEAFKLTFGEDAQPLEPVEPRPGSYAPSGTTGASYPEATETNISGTTAGSHTGTGDRSGSGYGESGVTERLGSGADTGSFDRSGSTESRGSDTLGGTESMTGATVGGGAQGVNVAGAVRPEHQTDRTGVKDFHSDDAKGSDVRPTESDEARPNVNAGGFGVAEPSVSADPSSAQRPTPKQQGGDRPLEEPSGEQAEAVRAKKDAAEGAQQGSNERAGEPMQMHDTSDPERQASIASRPGGGQHRDEPKGTGEGWVKTSGFAAEGGDFDATKPGAGKEANRLLEERGIVREPGKGSDDPSMKAEPAESSSSSSGGTMDKLKGMMGMGKH